MKSVLKFLAKFFNPFIVNLPRCKSPDLHLNQFNAEMQEEDIDNELSSDDEDYCPEKHKQTESASENSGPDEDYSENSDEEGTTKKAATKKKSAKGRKAVASAEKVADNAEIDPEEQKRRADAIWADFLKDDSEAVPETKNNESASAGKPSPSSTVTMLSSKLTIPAKVPAPVTNDIFEFAGKTIEVPPKNISACPKKTEEVKSQSTAPKTVSGIKRPSIGGGLSSVLSQLTKKNKLSVLEKTKQDWDGFKDDQGISEELQTHNRGRDGFLERRDFLERTDLRQFEIEKNLRLTRRK